MHTGARGANAPDHTRRVPRNLRRATRSVTRAGSALLFLLCLPQCSRSGGTTSRYAAPAAMRGPTELSTAVQFRFVQSLTVLATHLDSLAAIGDSPADHETWPVRMQRAFVNARSAYKRSEALFEFENGVTAQELNGAAVMETEENDGVRTSTSPTGFQVVEEALFPQVSLEDSAVVRYQIEVMQSLVRRASTLARAGSLTEANLFDAIRLQLARVSVLALANADSPIAERGLREGARSLEGVRVMLEPLQTVAQSRAPAAWSAWDEAVKGATLALDSADNSTIDRLNFTRTRLIPLAYRWNELRTALGVPLPPDTRAWRADAASIFDSSAFDAWQFAPAYTRGSDVIAAAALGAELFTDTRLSGDGTRSCKTCHDPDLAFTDGRTRSLTRSGAATLRNAPTLLNAALQRAQFADARAMFLEDQVADVVSNTHELGGALRAYATRLNADPAVRERFVRSFGEAGDSTVTELRVARALSAYERTLIAMNAPYDRYLRGDTAAMTLEARRGYSVFMGKGKCGTCHFAPLFNGTVPPVFARGELEVIGTPGTRGWKGVKADPDSGRARIYTASNYLGAFKTPTVRNAARTAPYMHNGVYRTLAEVLEFYNRGGGAGLGLDVPNQTLPFDRLNLTPSEKRALVAFMESLTDLSPAGLNPVHRNTTAVRRFRYRSRVQSSSEQSSP